MDGKNFLLADLLQHLLVHKLAALIRQVVAVADHELVHRVLAFEVGVGGVDALLLDLLLLLLELVHKICFLNNNKLIKLYNHNVFSQLNNQSLIRLALIIGEEMEVLGGPEVAPEQTTRRGQRRQRTDHKVWVRIGLSEDGGLRQSLVLQWGQLVNELIVYVLVLGN